MNLFVLDLLLTMTCFGLPGALLGLEGFRRVFKVRPPPPFEWAFAWLGAIFWMIMSLYICLIATNSYVSGRRVILFYSIVAAISASIVEVVLLFGATHVYSRITRILWTVVFAIIGFVGAVMVFFLE